MHSKLLIQYLSLCFIFQLKTKHKNIQVSLASEAHLICLDESNFVVYASLSVTYLHGGYVCQIFHNTIYNSLVGMGLVRHK